MHLCLVERFSRVFTDVTKENYHIRIITRSLAGIKTTRHFGVLRVTKCVVLKVHSNLANLNQFKSN